MKHTSLTISLFCTVALTGCYGAHPQFTPVDQAVNNAMNNRVIQESVMVKPKVEERATGSLWKKGSNHFFKDTRARKVGDIVTIIVNETATAAVEAKTETTREHTGTSGLTNLLNFEGWLTKRGIFPGAASLSDSESSREFTGDASTERDDKLEARIAVMVTQVLPNGYLFVQGQREVMVNYELQEIKIQGIIRPADITADNTIESEKVAEARISYAGRGIVDESQEPQPAVRFLDKWLPF